MEKNNYKWIAKCLGDRYFHNSSQRTFENKEEAYNDMRNAAIEKFKIDTDYKEDYLNKKEYNDAKIYINIMVSQNDIILNLYSGIYRYQIIEVNK